MLAHCSQPFVYNAPRFASLRFARRRDKLVKGQAQPNIDEDEYLEYEQSLQIEGDLLTPCVDAIGYTLKSGISGFDAVFDQLLAPFFGKILLKANCADVKVSERGPNLFGRQQEYEPLTEQNTNIFMARRASLRFAASTIALSSCVRS